MKMFKFFIVIMLFILTACSASKPDNEKHLIKGDILSSLFKEKNIFIDSSGLEAIGFEKFSASQFCILNYKSHTYLVNRHDCIAVRFTNGKPDRKYHASGQGPGEFLKPYRIILYSSDKIAILDIIKSQLLIFDLELNFLKEIKLPVSVRGILKTGEKFIAFGDFNQNAFAFLGEDFNLIESFIKIPQKTPFKNVTPYSLHRGYILNKNTIAYTHWQYYKKKCFVDIIEIKTRKTKLSLNWKQLNPPTQKDIDNIRNVYSSYYVNKYGKIFVVQNQFTQKLRVPEIHEILLFADNGDLISKIEETCQIIPSNSYEANCSLIYNLDDEANLCYWDISKYSE